MKKLLVLPTWIIVAIVRPKFPKSHPWKYRRFTLSDWAECSTPLNDAFSWYLWVAAAFLFLTGHQIFLMLYNYFK